MLKTTKQQFAYSALALLGVSLSFVLLTRGESSGSLGLTTFCLVWVSFTIWMVSSSWINKLITKLELERGVRSDFLTQTAVDAELSKRALGMHNAYQASMVLRSERARSNYDDEELDARINAIGEEIQVLRERFFESAKNAERLGFRVRHREGQSCEKSLSFKLYLPGGDTT